MMYNIDSHLTTPLHFRRPTAVWQPPQSRLSVHNEFTTYPEHSDNDGSSLDSEVHHTDGAIGHNGGLSCNGYSKDMEDNISQTPSMSPDSAKTQETFISVPGQESQTDLDYDDYPKRQHTLVSICL